MKMYAEKWLAHTERDESVDYMKASVKVCQRSLENNSLRLEKEKKIKPVR